MTQIKDTLHNEYQFRDENNNIITKQTPVIISKVIPIYPCEAKNAGLEGKVMVKALIDEEGKPIKYSIMSATNEYFEAAAVNAMMETRFRPAMNTGKPVKVWISYPFVFRLK